MSHCRHHSAFHLEAESQCAANDEKVEFSTLMRSPMVCLIWVNTQLLHDLVDDEALPRRTELGMTLQISLCREIEQRMQQPRIADEYLGCLHLTLAQILVPGLQLPDDERIGQLVEVAANGRIIYSERSTQLRGVPELRMVVREHQLCLKAISNTGHPHSIVAGGFPRNVVHHA